MASDATHPTAFPIAWRLTLALGLAVMATHLLVTTQYYATIIFLALTMLGLMFSVARLVLHWQSNAETHAVDRAMARLTTEQKRAVRSQDHLQALLDTVSAALLIVEQDGRVMAGNRAARLLLRSEGPGLSAVTAIGAQAAEAITQLAPGRPTLLRLANGQQMFAAAGLFASEGESRRLVSLQAVAGELDTLQLKAWEDMSRVLAHEIMNSLTPIASLSESLAGMIRQNGAKLEVIEAIDTVARRAQGLAGFVARHREVAELPEPKLKTVSLQTLVEDVQALMHERLAGVRFRCRLEVVSVTADPDLLSQALINLLHNAVDAVAGRDDSTIELICLKQDEHVTISVADNGAGIPAQFRDDIFVPFFTTKVAGSGIGLSVVRQIALKHGGRINVRPSSASGTIFELVLPTANR